MTEIDGKFRTLPFLSLQSVSPVSHLALFSELAFQLLRVKDFVALFRNNSVQGC